MVQSNGKQGFSTNRRSIIEKYSTMIEKYSTMIEREFAH